MKQSIVLVVLGAVILAILYFFYAIAPMPASGSPGLFTIASGEEFRSVAARLEREGFIRSSIGFELYAFLRGAAHRIQAGDYRLEQGMSAPDVVSLLVSGPPDIVVVVTEGETVRDIDNKLAAAGVLSPGAFTANAEILEGFLFPDTYRFAPHSETNAVINKFLDNFSRRVGVAVDAQTVGILARTKNRSSVVSIRGIDQGGAELYTAVILASLIEKEVPPGEERPLVAGILLKRLGRGMPLQVDASVIYAKCGGTFYGCSALASADFKINSPYNTYRYPGLPKGPIANPGFDAIRAAMNPKSSPYWYYLSDPETGRTIFSATLEEHAARRREYLGY